MLGMTAQCAQAFWYHARGEFGISDLRCQIWGMTSLGRPVGCYRIKAVRPHGAGAAGWPFAGKPVMKMLPSSVEEGVGGGADCDLIFLASGDNHAALGAPPLLNREGSYHEHFHPSWRTTQEGKKSCLAVGWRVGISFGFCGQGGLSRRCGEVGSIIQRHHAPNSFPCFEYIQRGVLHGDATPILGEG